MSFHTPQFHSSGSTIMTLATKSKYRHFTDPAEFDLYVAERGKKNAEGFRALGVPIIDFNHYTPKKHLSTVFECTPHLRGRLYPDPASPDLFVLDFIDHNDVRVLATGFIVYDVGDFGDEPRAELLTQGSLPERKAMADLYTLNPGRVVEITKDNQMLKQISFTYINGSTIKPIIQ